MRLVDTNVLIYAVSNREADAPKRARAEATLMEPDLALSVQDTPRVLQPSHQAPRTGGVDPRIGHGVPETSSGRSQPRKSRWNCSDAATEIRAKVRDLLLGRGHPASGEDAGLRSGVLGGPEPRAGLRRRKGDEPVFQRNLRRHEITRPFTNTATPSNDLDRSLLMSPIGRIVRIPIREVWRREDNNFTPWLTENLDQLGEALGMVLDQAEGESPVGRFSLDIVARNANTQDTVAIENQLEETDHSHLGQLLTYAAGTEAKTAIWIATKFKEEHRAALDMLNNSSNGEIAYFGVEVEAIRIGNSEPAALFQPVVTPNKWRKNFDIIDEETTPGQQRYIAYWRPLLERLNQQHNWGLTNLEYRTSQYNAGSGLRRGFGSFYRTMRFTNTREIRVEMVIRGPSAEWNKAVYDTLESNKNEIEETVGELVWERLDEAATSRLGYAKPGWIRDSEETLEQHRQWMIDRVTTIHNHLRPFLEDAQKTVAEQQQETSDEEPTSEEIDPASHEV